MTERGTREVSVAKIESHVKLIFGCEVTVYYDDSGRLNINAEKKFLLPLDGETGGSVDFSLRYQDEQIKDLENTAVSFADVIPLEAALDIQQPHRSWGVSFLFDPTIEVFVLQLTYFEKMPVQHPGWDSYWEEVRIDTDSSGCVAEITSCVSKARRSGESLEEKFLNNNGLEPDNKNVVDLREGSPWGLMFSELNLPIRFERMKPLTEIRGETAADQAVEVYRRLLESFQSVS